MSSERECQRLSKQCEQYTVKLDANNQQISQLMEAEQKANEKVDHYHSEMSTTNAEIVQLKTKLQEEQVIQKRLGQCYVTNIMRGSLKQK